VYRDRVSSAEFQRTVEREDVERIEPTLKNYGLAVKLVNMEMAKGRLI